uniref:Internal (Core) protein n=1 Tax=Enterobacter phage vB_EclP_26 TaxID=3161160 RepID=A0AAU7VF52_9CAUD
MHIRKATEEDVHYFLWHLSKDDTNEAIANFGSCLGMTERMLSHLTESSVVLTDRTGEVYAYGGNQGDNVWFLTSGQVQLLDSKGRREFIQRISEYRDLMLDQYGTIWNYVWSGNKSHIKFLQLLGAKFHDEWTKSPVTGEVFQLFTISKEDV